MRKRISFLLFCLLLVLSACGNEIDTGLATIDMLTPPAVTHLPIEGIWEIVQIDEEEANTNPSDSNLKVGDKLTVDSEFVALGDSITTSPSFSSKYVKLGDYLALRYVSQDTGLDPESYVTVSMIRDSDVFSLDLIALEDGTMLFSLESRLYHLKQNNGVVPEDTREEMLRFAKTSQEDHLEQNTKSKIATLIGLRTSLRDSAGYPYSGYETYLIMDDPEKTRPNVYKMNQLLVMGGENTSHLLEYEPFEPDINNDIMRGEFRYYATDDLDQQHVQVLEDYYGRNITFVQGNIVSFSKPSIYPPDADTPQEYEMHFLDKIGQDISLSVEEIGGPPEVDAMKEQVSAQLHFLDPKNMVPEDQFPVDLTNLGVIRRNLSWGFVTSMNWKMEDRALPSRVNLDIVPEIPVFDKDTDAFSWNRITNKVPLATTASSTPTKNRTLIKTKDELLYFVSTQEDIEDQPLLSIQLTDDATFISLGYYYDDQAEKVQDIFLQQDLLQPRVIYTD